MNNKEQSLWQPMSSAPKDRRILLKFEEIQIQIGMWSREIEGWEDWNGNFPFQPIKWMDLPKD